MEDFDSVFKKYGGYCDPNRLVRPEILNYAVEGCKNLIGQLRMHNSKLPDAHVAFIKNSRLNAMVSKKANHYYIGINMGVQFLLNDIFFRMLSNKFVLKEFGDISEESEVKTIYNPQITDTNVLFISKEPSEKIAPKNKERFHLAQLLTSHAINFLGMHEYAHINFGHLDYIINSTNKLDWSETIHYNSEKEKSIDPVISQTLEMDADCFAVSIGLRTIISANKNIDKVKPELIPFYKDLFSALKLWLFSIYTLFRLFGHSIPKMADIKTLSHPPASIRQHMVFSTACTFFIENKAEFIDKLKEVIPATISEVENAFKIISITKQDHSFFSFGHTTEASNHIIFLMRNWNKVRPLLEPYTFGNLAPLDASK